MPETILLKHATKNFTILLLAKYNPLNMAMLL